MTISRDLMSANAVAEWALIPPSDLSDWSLQDAKAVLRIVAERVKALESNIDQSVKTTASPSFAAVKVGGTQVVGAQQASWQAMSGTPNKESLYDVSTVTQVQIAARLKAIQDVLATHGLILEDI